MVNVAKAYQITTPVKQIMSSPTIATSSEEIVLIVADLMHTRKIGNLPVIYNDQVVGIITSTDLVNQLTISTEDEIQKMYHELIIKVFKQ